MTCYPPSGYIKFILTKLKFYGRQRPGAKDRITRLLTVQSLTMKFQNPNPQIVH